MGAFRNVTSRMAPLPGINIDTDQIIPASYLKVTDKEGMGTGLFANWRFDASGEPRADFVLNRPEYEGARILLAGDNYGCGSSREHAAWALLDYGFQVVISTGFADIFRANSAKNGLLTATITDSDHARLLQIAESTPKAEVTVDLLDKTIVTAATEPVAFEVDPFVRHCLLNGLDQLGYLLDRSDAIRVYEAHNPQRVHTTPASETERA
jgi:3-isopropylmalate/(R)-2-methylmalate dehydratase small subunit